MADSVQDSIVVNADPDTVLDVVADFDSYPQWQDEMLEGAVLETGPDGRGTKARFVIDAKVVRATLVLDYTYTPTSMSWTLVQSDKLRRNDGSYVMEDLGDGRTRVTYALEVELAVPVPGMIRRQAAKRIVDGGLKGLKARVESL